MIFIRAIVAVIIQDAISPRRRAIRPRSSARASQSRSHGVYFRTARCSLLGNIPFLAGAGGSASSVTLIRSEPQRSQNACVPAYVLARPGCAVGTALSGPHRTRGQGEQGRGLHWGAARGPAGPPRAGRMAPAAQTLRPQPASPVTPRPCAAQGARALGTLRAPSPGLALGQRTRPPTGSRPPTGVSGCAVGRRLSLREPQRAR